MKKPSRCRICADPVRDMVKLFDPHHGYVCPDCVMFMAYADRRLRVAGIEGIIERPQPEKP